MILSASPLSFIPESYPKSQQLHTERDIVPDSRDNGSLLTCKHNSFNM